MQKINQQKNHKAVVAQVVENPDIIWDKEWRMNNLYWIITKKGNKAPFKMNRAQREFFDKYLNNKDPKKNFHRHIILKSRQIGFTTFIDLWITDEILFNENREGLIIAHKVQDAAEIFDRKIDFAIRNMPEHIKDAIFKMERNSAKKIKIVPAGENDKESYSAIQVSTSGRGGTFHYLHVSEYAKMCVDFPKRADEVEKGAFLAVPTSGFIFIESTAEGMAGRFYEIFQAEWATRDKISPTKSTAIFLPHFYNWQYDDMEMEEIEEDIPVSEMELGEIDFGEYQKEHNLSDTEITYYYIKYLQLGGRNGTDTVKKLNQEYPTTAEEAFLSTGQSYFPTSKVFSMLQKPMVGTKGEMIADNEGKHSFQEVSTGALEIFEMPIKGMSYVIGGDTAEGLAHGDSQVLYVINKKTKNCAAIYSSKVPPDEFIGEAYNIGKFFNWALLGIEVNKDGLWVNDGLDKLGYINLYYRKSFDDITKKITKFFGWKTTSATRPFSLAAIKAVFLKKNEGFPNAVLNEMVTFLRNEKGKPEALAGKNDDVIMAGAIGYAILQEEGEWSETDNQQAGSSIANLMFNQ